ncbi:hypothetical protein [Sulfurimonas marina]|uniref:Uncharacterized protein n=1 Tax=Sulfurimonas marina TaxID=2590551 RepID=A0A7M1AUC0_9BACT|nr:hypothetical protein [Sulfurimonas marina]QOP41014.1 hypothetical protein FJR03_04340 [Sulfurimonas marina]
MEKIIKYIKETLFSDEDLSYIENYPIKIVHDQTRVKEDNVLETLQEIEFFDQEGFSNDTHTDKTIKFLHTNAPEYIQSVSFGISTKSTYTNFTFSEKYPQDRWKKIIDDEDLQAVIEISYFSDFDEEHEIETVLRDIMRSRKEVPLLKTKSFIWIADVTDNHDLTKIMKHYFQNNFTSMKTDEKTIFIGWNKQLQDINMRSFVFQPNL